MRWPLSFLVLVIALVPSVFAQDRKEREETPKQVFERAAYAEEHERDFEKASKLYREAGSMASFLNDTALADDAKKSLQRVEARMGKGVETTPSGSDLPLAVQRRLYLLVKQLCTPVEGQDNGKNYEAINQIVPFGEAAVPILEKALNAEHIPDPDRGAAEAQLIGFRGDSTWAARALARIDDPEGDAASDTPRSRPVVAAFLRALKSPDPLVRNAVLREANATRHRDVLDEALKDSNPAMVSRAIVSLAQTSDPGLGDLMKKAVYRNDEAALEAMEWLVRMQLADAVAAMKDEKLLSGVLRRGVTMIAQSQQLDQSKKLQSLVDVAETSSKTAGILFEEVTNSGPRPNLNWSALKDDLKSRIEPLALKALETTSEPRKTQALLSILSDIGSLTTAEAIVRSMEAGRLSDDPSVLANAVGAAVNRAQPEQFAKAAELVRRASASLPEKNRGYRNNLYENLRRSAAKASTADITAGLEAAPPDQKNTYISNIMPQVKAWSVPFAEAVMKSGDDNQRALVMSTIGNKRDTAFLPVAIAGLSDPAEVVRGNAASGFRNLAYYYPDQAATQLLERIKSSDKPSAELLGALASLNTKTAMSAIESLWQAQPDRRKDLYGIVSGSQMGGDEANKFLVENFKTAESEQRRNAILSFGRTLYQPAIDVIGASLSDANAEVRSAAQQTLEVFRKHREALEEFKRWKTGDDEARASISELLKLLESQNKDVVIGAVRSLGAVKAKGALPALVKLLDRPDPDLKKAVDDAIKKIGE